MSFDQILLFPPGYGFDAAALFAIIQGAMGANAFSESTFSG